MKCSQHPTVNCPKGKQECFLCGDSSLHVENDKFKFEYERMAQHVQPGITGIRTKGQYQRLLKRHGLTDDIGHKELVRCVTDTSKRERVREEKIKRYLDRMTDPLHRRLASRSR